MENTKKRIAVIAIDGKQVKVVEGQSLLINKRKEAEGSFIVFDQVLLVESEGQEIMIGKPFVKGVSVKAEVVGERKGDKVIIYKKRRRQGYAVKNGFRKHYSTIVITAIQDKK